MAEERFVIAKAIRAKYRVFPITEADFKRFSNISIELFNYLKEVKKIDFKVYFRVDFEMIEFITPKSFSLAQIDLILSARSKDYSNLDICVERKDYPRFELLITEIRDKKIERLIERNPELDRRTLINFANLSSASQMIVRGGINKSVAAKAKESAARLIDDLLDSHVVMGTLSRMILADETLYDHSASVAMMSGIMARQMLGKSKEFSECAARAGLYHDVGKTCVPGEILNKPGKFTPEEFDIMKTHTTLGYQELIKAKTAGAPIEEEVARVALEHHEKFKGGGYPLGKLGRLEEIASGIHEYSRIVTIADIYSALLMKRVYKEAYDQERSLALMRSMAPNDYDPKIWEIFEKTIVESVELYASKDKALSAETHNSRILMRDEYGHLKEIQNKKRSAS